MVTKISRDIFESYLNCNYKAHLKLRRQQGAKSDYELLLAELRGEVRFGAIEQISTHQQDTARDLLLSLATLRRGVSFLLDATLEDCVALRKVTEFLYAVISGAELADQR